MPHDPNLHKSTWHLPPYKRRTHSGVPDLRKAAAKFGGTVTDESGGRWFVYQIEAPEGKVWVDGHVTAIKCEWLRGSPKDWKSNAINEALGRIEHGLENADEPTG